LRERVGQQAEYRCGYCRAHQIHILGLIEIDHIYPLSLGGTNDEANLWLACRLCNGYKSDQIDAIDPHSGEIVPLYNPRTQDWTQHFAWSDDGSLVLGLTPTGRATIAALQLNNDISVTVRRQWILVGWHPPK
jgi:hypothetical protein